MPDYGAKFDETRKLIKFDSDMGSEIRKNENS